MRQVALSQPQRWAHNMANHSIPAVTVLHMPQQALLQAIPPFTGCRLLFAESEEVNGGSSTGSSGQSPKQDGSASQSWGQLAADVAVNPLTYLVRSDLS